MDGIFTFILKLAGIIGVSFVAYGLATTKTVNGMTDSEETHPVFAVILELGAIFIILVA